MLSKMMGFSAFDSSKAKDHSWTPRREMALLKTNEHALPVSIFQKRWSGFLIHTMPVQAQATSVM